MVVNDVERWWWWLVLVDGLMNERGNKSINIINEAKCQEQNIVMVLYGDRDGETNAKGSTRHLHTIMSVLAEFMFL